MQSEPLFIGIPGDGHALVAKFESESFKPGVDVREQLNGASWILSLSVLDMYRLGATLITTALEST